ncbi:heterocyst development glycosyltransferase HepC [Leptothoe sp. ISB3NOV94-8A]
MTSYILPLKPSVANIFEVTDISSYRQSIFASYNLNLRQNILWVALNGASESLPHIPVQQIVKCLKHYPVSYVCIDPSVGEAHLKVWAEACLQIEKSLYLRVPKGKTPAVKTPWSWKLKRSLDWIAAFLGTIAISPVLLLIAFLVSTSSTGPIFYRQWRVGTRGKLYQVWKFRTMVANAEALHHTVMGDQNGLHKQENDPRITSVGRWLRKYSLDELPQLINVLRGEMSLVGPRPWALYDALRVPENGLERLRAMPGITGEWQVMARSNLRDLASVTECDLNYLHTWSIQRDFRLLMLTFPKVLTGFGAC